MTHTAVEWLVEQLQLLKSDKAEWMSESATISKALRMEREQIMNAFDIRKIDIAFDKKTTSDQYYTQTYGTRLQNETN